MTGVILEIYKPILMYNFQSIHSFNISYCKNINATDIIVIDDTVPWLLTGSNIKVQFQQPLLITSLK